MQSTLKAIPESRERLQSRILVWSVGLTLAIFCVPCFVLMIHPSNTGWFRLQAFGVSLTFGVLVWALRAATLMAAVCGGMVCLLVTLGTMGEGRSLLHTALTPLALLFVLTFVATQAGKARKPGFTPAREARRGRSASQVIANLGFAALVAIGGWHGTASQATAALLLASLAEATADTVSSEIGQAFGGTPYLLTSFRPAAPGTDGAVSLLGTVAGVFGAALVTVAGAWAMQLDLQLSVAAFIGGVAGLLFDSLLGATVERRGWLNNDLVNFSSTAFAAGIALLLLVLTR